MALSPLFCMVLDYRALRVTLGSACIATIAFSKIASENILMLSHTACLR